MLIKLKKYYNSKNNSKIAKDFYARAKKEFINRRRIGTNGYGMGKESINTNTFNTTRENGNGTSRRGVQKTPRKVRTSTSNDNGIVESADKQIFSKTKALEDFYLIQKKFNTFL